jgi:hypothetical protein
MINFGAVNGAKKPISKLKSMLWSMGPEGSFTLNVKGKSETDLQINEDVTVRVMLPCTIEYVINEKAMTLRFSKPVLGMTRLLNKFCDKVTIEGLERLLISLQWAPDGYVEIES